MLNVTRLSAVLAGLWAGAMLAIGVLGAPAAFATAAPEVAGRIVGRMFMQEAHVSLVLGVVLFIMLRKRAQTLADRGQGSVFSTDMLLVLGALFLTVTGYFALQPMMQAARSGQGTLSFGALHGLSAGAFGLKGLLVLALAWRLSVR